MRTRLGTLGALFALCFAFAPAIPASADPPPESDSQAAEGQRRSADAPPHRAANGDRGRSGSAARPTGGDDAARSPAQDDGSAPSAGGSAAKDGPQPCPPASGNPGGSQPCGPPPCPPASPNAGGTQPCGFGPEHDNANLAAAAAEGAWAGRAGKLLSRILATATRRGNGVEAAGDIVTAGSDGHAVVLDATAQRESAPEELQLDDLELARSGLSQAGERSLLAMTGMALLTLLAISLFAIGLGRLLRGAEGDAL